MSLVLELIGLKKSATSTPIAPLGINSPINKLQTKSQNYFTIAADAVAADGDQLGVSITRNGAFDLTNPAHKEHITECLALFKEQKQKLHILDQKIIYSALLGIVGSSLSFIPFVSYIGLAGWGSTIFHLAQRNSQFNEYQETLKLLVATCNWSLGPVSRKNANAELTTDLVMRDMMAALYPVLTEKQVRHLIADDIEEVFAQELRVYESKYHLNSAIGTLFNTAEKKADERIALGKRSAEFNRCVYGYQKGNALDYLDAFVSIFPDLYKMIVEQCNYVQHYFKKEAGQTTTNPNTHTAG